MFVVLDKCMEESKILKKCTTCTQQANMERKYHKLHLDWNKLTNINLHWDDRGNLKRNIRKNHELVKWKE